MRLVLACLLLLGCSSGNAGSVAASTDDASPDVVGDAQDWLDAEAVDARETAPDGTGPVDAATADTSRPDTSAPEAAPPCGPATCPHGCCAADGSCQTLLEQHSCGSSGQACQDCGDPNPTCGAIACSPIYMFQGGVQEILGGWCCCPNLNKCQ